MKIIYCIPSCYGFGGMERVLSIKANYLADIMGYDISIITTNQKEHKNHYDFSRKIHFYDLDINYDELQDVPIYKKIIKTKEKKKRHQKILTQLLKQQKADIVISMFTHEISFLYKIKDGSKKIVEIHFSKNFRQLHNACNHISFIKRAISYYLDYKNFSHVSHYNRFVVLTEEDKKSWGNLKNIEVIYNPLSFAPDQTANIDSKTVLATGRLCPQKGFDMLIDIWKMIQDESKNSWKLCIYGDGPDYKELNKQIIRNGLQDSIYIYPPTMDIKSVYLSSSIFCFPSRYEGFSMALSEAMACGLPSISFNCPCGPSELIRNEKNGILVENKDIKSFAKLLLQLIEDRDRRYLYSINASIEVKEKLNIDTIMDKWVDLFKTINR